MTARRVLALVLVTGSPGIVAAQSRPTAGVSYSWTTVTYLSGAMVYLAAGSKQGVREGAKLEVLRAGEVIAELSAAFTSSNQSSCTIVRSTGTVVIGDSVRYVAAVDSLPGVGEHAVGATPTVRRSSAVRHPLRGRVGLRYLVVETGAGTTLTQPAFDLRLDGQRLGGTGLGVAVDVRAQRSSYSGASTPSPTSLNRVYQMAMLWNRPGGGPRVSVGRQFAGALSTIGIFDGVALDFDRTRWTYGMLVGAQPEVVTFGLSTATREYGAYVQRHNAPGTLTPWSVTVGAIGSYTNGQIDREFGYLRTTYNSRRVSIFAAQEIDANRGWKRAVEGSAATFTSTFVTAQVAASEGVNLYGGFDNRRSVRLYRDYVNPEIAFDDAFREGVWGGTSLNLLRRVRLTADARSSSGGIEGSATSYTGSLALSRLTPLHVGLRARTTQYSGQQSTGSLSSASLEIAPVPAIRLEVSAGVRNTSYPLSGAPATRLTWTGVDADIGIGRKLYLMLSTYRESGAPDRTIQSYLALSYRF
jgi:hypothetical protein